MKKVKLFYRINEFEDFVNSPDIEIIQLDIKGMDMSSIFQECFFAVVYYETLQKNTRAKDWNKIQDCGVRLRNVLLGKHTYKWDKDTGKISYPHEIMNIEKITKKEFLRYRNAGKKTWDEFVELRGF